MSELRWTVVRDMPERPTHAWCQCSCGVEKAVNKSNMARGLTLSCGCLARELSRARKTTHGMSNRSPSTHPLYGTWHNMIQRCHDPRSASYANYGGRGISVCSEWRADFLAFLADVGEKPSPHHSLDRIDNDGDYEPGNVRWATASEQGLNRRLKTHCANGHEFTAENTGTRSDGRGRECLTCKRVWSLSRSIGTEGSCPCGHRFLCHRYNTATRRNDGACLVRGCRCNDETED